MPSAADAAARNLPTADVQWRPGFRLVASRFPPIDLFERVADPADWDALHALESLTNPRLRDATGEIALVPVADRVAGPGATILMAPFTHLNPVGSRFADATHGALYLADTLDTAIAETRYHRERFLRATHEPPTEVELRCYLIDVAATLHDLRGRAADPRYAGAYSPDDYGASQALARALRAAGSDGVIYDSVRRRGGINVAAFRPRLASNVRQSVHLRYAWNGERIAHVYELKLLGD
jgi:RES domain-containing protein